MELKQLHENINTTVQYLQYSLLEKYFALCADMLVHNVYKTSVSYFKMLTKVFFSKSHFYFIKVILKSFSSFFF